MPYYSALNKQITQRLLAVLFACSKPKNFSNMTKFPIYNFFQDDLPSDRIQNYNDELFACFQPKNKAILPDKTSR